MSMRDSQGVGKVISTVAGAILVAALGVSGWTLMKVVNSGEQIASIETELRSISRNIADIKTSVRGVVTKPEFEAFRDQQQRIDERQTDRIDGLEKAIEQNRRDFMEHRK